MHNIINQKTVTDIIPIPKTTKLIISMAISVNAICFLFIL